MTNRFTRFIEAWREKRRLERELAAWWQGIEHNLSARKQARCGGQTYVATHCRRRST